MATMHAPGTGLGGKDLRSRRAAVVAAVVLAFLAIVVPFVVDAVHDHGRAATTARQTAPQATPSGPTAQHSTGPSSDSSLGSQGDLPSLLPAQARSLTDGQPVRVGDATTGTVQRTAGTGWQVLVRWDGRLQPLPTRGPASSSRDTWVASSGLLYTRVPTGTPGRFHVFAWNPIGGSAYTPPTLVATPLGDVCFDQAFTAFGGCSQG